MATNYLPSDKAVSIFGGELYFQKDGEARMRSLGHCDALGWTPSIEEEDIYAATSGVRKKIATLTREISASLSLTLKEATVENMAAAMQGDVANFIQAAQTAAVVSEADVVPGEMIDLGALNVSNVSVSDGTGELVAGVDYVLNAEAGTVLVYSEQAVFEITYDAPEITALDGKKAVEILANQGGVSGLFTVIGRNEQGKRYKLSGVRAKLKPSGDVALLSDGSSVQTIELEGSCIENAADPAYPWGRLVELN